MIADLRDSEQSKQTEINKLTKALEEAQRENEEQEKKSKVANARVTALRTENKQLKADLGKKRATLECREQQVDMLTAAKEQLFRDLDSSIQQQRLSQV